VNIIGYSGTNGLDILDTVTIPHYSQSNSKSVKVPFSGTVAAETYAGATGTHYKYAYYLSTETGAQFKANKLTLNNVKFVY